MASPVSEQSVVPAWVSVDQFEFWYADSVIHTHAQCVRISENSNIKKSVVQLICTVLWKTPIVSFIHIHNQMLRSSC